MGHFIFLLSLLPCFVDGENSVLRVIENITPSLAKDPNNSEKCTILAFDSLQPDVQSLQESGLQYVQMEEWNFTAEDPSVRAIANDE